MKKLMLLAVLLVGMVLVQGCKEEDEIYYDDAEVAQIDAYNTMVEKQQQEALEAEARFGAEVYAKGQRIQKEYAIEAEQQDPEYQKREAARLRAVQKAIETRDKAAMEREDRKREQPVIPVDDCAKIGTFLIQHSEFGSYSSLNSIEFIGNLPSNGKAYNVPLANGRTLQFIFRNNDIVLVGEEVPGGYIAHYGRM